MTTGPAPEPLLVCRIGARAIAIPVADVAEVLPLLPVHAPAGLPAPLAGFVQVAGRLVAVLRPMLLLDPDAATAAIGVDAHIVRLRALPDMALLVGRADAVLVPVAIRPAAPGHSPRDAVTGEIDTDGGVAHVVAIDRLLVAAERMRIAALRADAERRVADWATAG